jgi:hypothetical protein
MKKPEQQVPTRRLKKGEFFHRPLKIFGYSKTRKYEVEILVQK